MSDPVQVYAEKVAGRVKVTRPRATFTYPLPRTARNRAANNKAYQAHLRARKQLRRQRAAAYAARDGGNE